MREYKFYSIGEKGCVEGPPAARELPDDRTALQQAKSLTNGHDVEVWQGTRIVAYVTTDERDAPSA